jgi:N-acyl-D-amino-acid deacylase
VSKSYDVLIRGASVHDGMGGAPGVADVAIENGHVAAVGSLDAAVAKHEIDAAGLALCPGFIDVHTHDDFAALAHRDMAFKSRGGVTTCIVGNCGFGAAPFNEAVDMLGRLTPGLDFKPYQGHAGYAQSLETNRPGINIGVLAGHGTIRMASVGNQERVPSDTEMAQMKAHLQEALDAGVFGMSSGLIYAPGRYARTEELAELAATMQSAGGLYATHMRDEGEGLLDSVAEAIDIGARAGVGVQISHHKASGRESWGLVSGSLALIEAAKRRGEDVHADQYPYTAGSTSLQAILENGAFVPGATGGIGGVSADDVVVASCAQAPEWEGQSIAQLAQAFGQAPRATAQAVVARDRGTTAILHMMSEADVQLVMRHPSTMIGSDGIPTLDGRPHPRLYNSFARVLGHYSRDVGLFDLPTAIYRMCGFPARKFGLTGRGEINVGACADLVLFDAGTIVDMGTFENPNQYPRGISHVLVNGNVAIRNGEVIGSGNGGVLRRPT